MTLFTKEEMNNMKDVMKNGLPLPDDTNVSDFTLSIWEAIAKLPHPVDSTFNILGNSSILTVLNENKESVMIMNIDAYSVTFEVGKPLHQYNSADRHTAAFATMTTIGVWNKLKYFV